jgi:hypothetical protein
MCYFYQLNIRRNCFVWHLSILVYFDKLKEDRYFCVLAALVLGSMVIIKRDFGVNPDF